MIYIHVILFSYNYSSSSFVFTSFFLTLGKKSTDFPFFLVFVRIQPALDSLVTGLDFVSTCYPINLERVDIDSGKKKRKINTMKYI